MAKPSASCRASAASGSFRSPCGCSMSDSSRLIGKAALSGLRMGSAIGSPRTTKANTGRSGCCWRKYRISSLTQRDETASGEQITTSASEASSAASMLCVNEVEVDRSSRSRKTGRSLPGRRSPSAWEPLRRTFGTR